MIHNVRYSAWVALGWIGVYLMLWSVLYPLGAAILSIPWGRNPPSWWLAALGGVFLVCWVAHSRQYWKRVFDDTPQIELHPTFVRAKQLDADILWKDVQDIRASQSGIGWDQRSKLLYLSLVGGRRVELDLAGLDTGMEQVHRLACKAWETDIARRRAAVAFDPGKAGAAPPEPVRTHGYGAGELGAEIARFGPSTAGAAGEWFMAFVGLAMTVFALWLDRSNKTPVLLLMGGMACALSIPLLLRGMRCWRVRLVLCHHGLIYVGLLRRYTLRYGDISSTSVLSVRRAFDPRSTPISIELILRDGQVIKLSNLKDIAAAGQRIEQLRRAPACEDRTMGAEHAPGAWSQGRAP